MECFQMAGRTTGTTSKHVLDEALVTNEIMDHVSCNTYYKEMQKPVFIHFNL